MLDIMSSLAPETTQTIALDGTAKKVERKEGRSGGTRQGQINNQTEVAVCGMWSYAGRRAHEMRPLQRGALL